MANILAVDDARDLCTLLKTALERDGHTVETRTSGTQLTDTLCRWADCILLDVMMPGEDGFATCRRIRAITQAPILFLTARTDEQSVLTGLGIGADDYLTKPFRPTVLLMRVKSLLRRVEMERGGDPTDRDIAVGDLRFSGDEKRLFCRERPLALSPNELKMLLFLMRGEGKAFSRDELLTHIWGWESDVSMSVHWVHISNIRKKLAALGAPASIRFVRGAGYILEASKDASTS